MYNSWEKVSISHKERKINLVVFTKQDRPAQEEICLAPFLELLGRQRLLRLPRAEADSEKEETEIQILRQLGSQGMLLCTIVHGENPVGFVYIEENRGQGGEEELLISVASSLSCKIAGVQYVNNERYVSEGMNNINSPPEEAQVFRISGDELLAICFDEGGCYKEKKDIALRGRLMATVQEELQLGRYQIYLQPQMELNTEKLIGAEALVRRVKEDGTYSLPDKFIPFLEKNGLISYIDLYVLEEVAKFSKGERDSGREMMPVSVNFSRATLLEKDIVSKMKGICDKYGMDVGKICIEITESIDMMTMNEMVLRAKEIQKAGFRLSLDDYGSNYSNVVILAKIEFDEVKLDKSIIQMLQDNPKAKSIVASTINLCKSFTNTRVVAEGIETKETLDILKAFNCDCGQGHYFSKPININRFKEKYILLEGERDEER